MMNFIKSSRLSYAILEAPIIFHEVVEEIQTSAEFDSKNDTNSSSLKNDNYVKKSDVITSCFKIRNNFVFDLPQLVALLNDMGYLLPTSHLDKIVRKALKSNGVILLSDVT